MTQGLKLTVTIEKTGDPDDPFKLVYSDGEYQWSHLCNGSCTVADLVEDFAWAKGKRLEYLKEHKEDTPV